MLSSSSVVLEDTDADTQQTTNQHLATSASDLISNYILAKLLGTSVARLPTGVLLPTDISLDRFAQVPPVPLPVFPHAYDKVNSRPVSSELDVAGAVTAPSNKSADSNIDVAEGSQVEESVDPPDAPVGRVPVTSPSSLHHRHHRLDVNEVKETLMEWNGDRGKARSVSNAAANLVVFAPLFPGTAVRKPEVVIPTVTSVTFKRSPPSTAPSSLSSLRAIVEKSLGEESDESGSDSTAGDTETTDNDRHLSENVSTAELEPFKSGPAAADTEDEQVEDVGLIAQDLDYVTPVTGFHLRPRLLPKASLPRDDPDEPVRTAAVSYLLPPDNAPWTISEDPESIAPDKQLSVDSDGQDEENVIKPTLSDSESKETPPLRDSETTTDPTVYMYTVLSSVTRQPVDEEPDDTDYVRDDVEDDVGHEDGDDVEYNDGQDVIDDIRDDFLESQSAEVIRDDKTAQPAVKDARRLSPEFLRVMQSLWPGLEICAGPQCNSEDTTDALSSSSDMRDEVTASPFTRLRLDTEYDFPAVPGWKQKFAVFDSTPAGEYRHLASHATSTQSVATPTVSTTDVTQSSLSPTMPSSWQVRESTSFHRDSTTTSPIHGLPHRPDSYVADDHVTLTGRKNMRTNMIAAADSNMKMTSDEDQEEGLKTTVTLRPTTTTSDIKLIDNTYELPAQRQQASLIASSSMPDSRPVSTLSVPATGTLEGLIRNRGMHFHHHHRLRADPSRREKSHADVKERPFRQRHSFLPPNFSFRRNPTIMKPPPDLRGLPDRRRAQIVDKDSGLVRSSIAESQINEETPRRFGSPFNVHRHEGPTHPGLPYERTVIFASQGRDEEELLGKKTISSPAGRLMNRVREQNGVTSSSTTITDDRNHEKTDLEKAEGMFYSRIAQSASNTDHQEQVRLEQTTHKSSSRASWPSSTKDREQNVKDKGSKMPQFVDNASKVSVSTSTDLITSVRSSTPSDVDDFESSATPRTTTSRPMHIKSIDSVQTTSDKIEVPPLTATSKLPDVLDQPQTDSSQTTSTAAARPLSDDSAAVSPGKRAPLPVQARAGENGHSAATIAMLGGYADWMVGLISAVAVAVFIFLAILSFLAVVSCRCVSSR